MKNNTLIEKIKISVIAVLAFAIILPVNTVSALQVCGTPLGGDTAERSSVVAAAYKKWKADYVTQNGAGGDIRVQRSDFDQYDTVSEGIAYGMLFAVYNNDKTTFDGLWSYAQKHVNQNGVMHWRVNANGTVTGQNGATDADEDIAAALIAADKSWGGYQAAALKQIAIIKKYQVEQNSYVVKPGDVWGGSDLLNPSYLAPSYYEAFAEYSGDRSWINVKDKSFEILKASQNKSTGLVPDWSSAVGTAVSGMSFNYGYDASRAPLRLAMSAAWTCDQSAVGLLAPYNAYKKTLNLSQLKSSYKLDGSVAEQGNGVPLLAAATTGAMTSQDTVQRANSWKSLIEAPSSSYYPDSMRMFGLLIASGVMESPTKLAKREPVTTPLPAASLVKAPYEVISSTTSANVGQATTLNAGVVSASKKEGVIIDLELYDAAGKRVAQQVYDNKALSSDRTNYSLTWTPSETGQYTLKAGLFKGDWSELYHWNNSVTTISVKAKEVVAEFTVPEAVSTPVSTEPAMPVTVTPVASPAPAPAISSPAPVTPAIITQPSQPTTPVVVDTPVIQIPVQSEPVVVTTPAPAAPVVATPASATPTASTPTVTSAPSASTPAPAVSVPTQTETPLVVSSASLSIWWPGSTQAVSGTQPFKAVIDGLDPSAYEMYWQVDGGNLNKMNNVRDNAPHKLSEVNLSGWKWSNTQRYTINFVAKSLDGKTISQKSTVITVYN